MDEQKETGTVNQQPPVEETKQEQGPKPPEDKPVEDPQEGPITKILVDDSHKYTNVYASQDVGVGQSHHYYVITKKDGGILDTLQFQNGAINEAGVNGVMDENLLAILIDRLKGFQGSPYACKENATALSKLELALACLKERTANRIIRGVEGTHQR